MSRSSVRSMVWALVAVIGVLIVSPWPAQAGQGPPSIPGNPGVPGLLAQIEALDAEIAALQAELAAKDAEIADLQSQIAAKDAEIATLLAQIATQSQAPVAQTGQTTSFAEGDDGDIQAGVPFPTPRFTDNLDGTVTDNLTGLIWLKNANCFGFQAWANALNAANTLHDTGTPETTDDCGLTDGSAVGAWRLANVKELQSLIDFGFFGPALSNAAGTVKWTEGDAFSGVQSPFYWSSTTYAGNVADFAWGVFLDGGITSFGGKGFTSLVWPVRGGQ